MRLGERVRVVKRALWANRMQLVQSISQWRDRWDRFEAAVGLIAAFMLAFGPLTVAVFALIFSLSLAEWWVAGIAAIVMAVTCSMALWLLEMAESAFRQFRTDSLALPGHASWSMSGDSTKGSSEPPRRPSFAMRLASELPPLPLVARLPLALWWLAHFAAGTALVEFADVFGRERLLWEGLSDPVPAAIFGYVFHFAANVFLELAVTACFGSPGVTAGVWRRRFAIDALCTLPLLLRILG